MWYISAGLKPFGPFELIEIHEKIRKGFLSPYDLIFKDGVSEWKPAQEWDEVRHLGFPAFEAVGTDPKTEPIWIVLRNFQQEGPLAGQQIVSYLEEGRFKGGDLVWKKGLSGWSRLADRLEFTSPDL